VYSVVSVELFYPKGDRINSVASSDVMPVCGEQKHCVVEAYNYVTGPAAAVVEECEPQIACGH
jgi:hypothetical protein